MKIHLHSKNGMFTVEDFGRDSITLSTKHSSFSVPCDDFKCFAGGINAPSEYERQGFLGIVRPFEACSEADAKAKAQQLAELLTEGKDIYEDIYLRRFEDNMELFDSKGKFGLTNWKALYLEMKEKYESAKDNYKDKLRLAERVYNTQLDLSNWQCNENGIKFIIQLNKEKYKPNKYRLCFDPFEIMPNFHSALSDLYTLDSFDWPNWKTQNGGWLKVIGDTVVLYAKSGDYGVYDDEIAIQCAKEIFPNKKIQSFAGKEWSEVTFKITIEDYD